MKASDFYDACAAHDWTYQYSDDSRAYNRGKKMHDELLRAAYSDSNLMRIFSEWSDHMTTGAAFGTARTPKPVRPE